MSRRLLVLAAFALPLLTGCNLLALTEAGPQPDEDSFLTDVGMAGAGAAGWTQDDLLNAGYAVCDGYRDGYSVPESAQALETSHAMSTGGALLLALSAATNLCPDVEADLN